ncbi:MAG: GCN5-Related N-Acetyltransferase [Actinomycetota bacterium]
MLNGLRVLDTRNYVELSHLLEAGHPQHMFVQSRIANRIIEPMRNGGELWGWYESGQLKSAIFVGPIVVPVELNENAVAGFAQRLSLLGRRCSSIVGTQSDVQRLWTEIEGWAPPRLVRSEQPFLTLEESIEIGKPDKVRPATLADLDSYLSASIAMFTAEVGVSPVAGGMLAYRSRVEETIRNGLAFGWFAADGSTLFKLDIGAIVGSQCQVQGVWLEPHLRGQGLSKSLLSQALSLVQSTVAPEICLYVNGFNEPALRVYKSLGFVQKATFSTMFF